MGKILYNPLYLMGIPGLKTQFFGTALVPFFLNWFAFSNNLVACEVSHHAFFNFYMSETNINFKHSLLLSNLEFLFSQMNTVNKNVDWFAVCLIFEVGDLERHTEELQ